MSGVRPVTTVHLASCVFAGYSSHELLQMLEAMLVLRRLTEVISDDLTFPTFGYSPAIASGREAIPVGVLQPLLNSDGAFCAEQLHTHFLALHGRLPELFIELLGKRASSQAGPQAALEAAIMYQQRQGSGIAVSYFGSGASREPAFHESLAIAVTRKLPLLFVCENDPRDAGASRHEPIRCIDHYTASHGITPIAVDGFDVIAIATATRAVVNDMRAAGGPALLEIALGAQTEVDPIALLRDRLRKANELAEDTYDELVSLVSDRIDGAYQLAERIPYAAELRLEERTF